MKTTYTIAAIAMFAVMMGLATIAPAALAQPMAKVSLCHNDWGDDGVQETDDDSWVKISVSGNAKDKHIANHGDFEVVDEETENACDLLVNPPVDPLVDSPVDSLV